LQSGQTYYLEATSYASSVTGNYTLTASAGILSATSSPWASSGGGQTINGSLASSDAPSHARSGSYADYYTLTGSGPTTVTMTGFDTFEYLYNSSRQQVASDDDGAGNLGSRITYSLQSGQT